MAYLRRLPSSLCVCLSLLSVAWTQVNAQHMGDPMLPPTSPPADIPSAPTTTAAAPAAPATPAATTAAAPTTPAGDSPAPTPETSVAGGADTETTTVPSAVDTTTGNSISEGADTETTAVPPAVATTTGNSISEGTVSWTPVKLESPVPGGPVPSGALDGVPVLTALGPEARNLSGCCLDGFRYDHGCPAVINGDPNICTNGEWILQGTTTFGA